MTNANSEATTMNWADLYQETEKLWTGPIQEFLGSDFFVRWLETGREVYLSQMEVSRESVEKYWEAVRLPHRGDLASLAEQVVTVESKVEALDDRTQTVVDRLSGIEALLARLDAQLLATNAARPERKVPGKE